MSTIVRLIPPTDYGHRPSQPFAFVTARTLAEAEAVK